jgi:hypothetical protein
LILILSLLKEIPEYILQCVKGKKVKLPLCLTS